MFISPKYIIAWKKRFQLWQGWQWRMFFPHPRATGFRLVLTVSFWSDIARFGRPERSWKTGQYPLFRLDVSVVVPQLRSFQMQYPLGTRNNDSLVLFIFQVFCLWCTQTKPIDTHGRIRYQRHSTQPKPLHFTKLSVMYSSKFNKKRENKRMN